MASAKKKGPSAASTASPRKTSARATHNSSFSEVQGANALLTEIGIVPDPFETLAANLNHDLWCYAEGAAEPNLYEPWEWDSKVVQLKAKPTGNVVLDSPADVIEFPRAARQLRMAVRAAVAAFEQSGRMVDAALAYAAQGLPIFHLDPKTKRPIPKRDPDPTGKFKDGIPGTGGVYKATCDPIIIQAWWRDHPKALIGLPMGERTGVWCLDVDTDEEHADGVAEWAKIVAQHDPIVTREHRSASGGPHLLFNWSAERWIGCSSGALPRGIDVKGHGGYIVVPPSQRKGRSYTVFSDIDPIDEPQWLLDLILQGRTARQWSGPRSHETVDLKELSEIVSFIPNLERNWDEWKSMALRIFASIDDAEEGFAVFQDWSQKLPEYDPLLGPSADRECWDQVCGCPPDHTSVFVLRKMAREAGWVPKLQTTTPTYQINGIELTAAQERIRRQVREFLRDHVAPKAEVDPNPWPAVWAMQVDTGVGKTQIIIEELATFLREVKLNGPIVYAVPQHKLSKEIVERFRERGINARIFYGQTHIDPEKYDPSLLPEDQKLMCLRNDNALKLAMLTHADIYKTCCKQGSNNKCPLIDKCGYFAQQVDAETVEVWIVAADMLFFAQKVFKKTAAVIVDEGMWQKGLKEYNDDWVIPINSLFNPTGNEVCDQYRKAVANLLLMQQSNGAVVAEHLQKFYPDQYREAYRAEWKLVAELLKKIGQKPSMSDDQIDTLLARKDIIDDIQITRRMITLWGEIATLMYLNDIKVSGRLRLSVRTVSVNSSGVEYPRSRSSFRSRR